MSEEFTRPEGSGPGGAAQGGEALLRPDSYDGIQEYDNPIPRWLMAIFYLSIIFSLGYVPYYLIGYVQDTHTPQTELHEKVEQLQALRKKNAPPVQAASLSEEMLTRLAQDPAVVAAGKTQFMQTCASCHGQEAEGVVGPNLKDTAWLHGDSLMEIRATIVNGVLDKGMLAWGTMLKPDAINSLVAFIYSLGGTSAGGGERPHDEPRDATSPHAG